MPEIGEVARIVNRLRANLVGKTITEITVFEDNIIYKDTTHDAFKNALRGKRVVEARQWGKYFWLVMDSPPHPLMHFGMSGWIYIKNDPYAHYRSTEPTKEPEWPPKYLKFNLQLSNADEIAFTDPRRLGRIRLIDHPNGDLRGLRPLAESGPDPVLEPVSIEWITEKLQKRKVPVKTWLLDQSVLAGVGNWVGDEILYHARIHPEQHTNTLITDQIVSLHRALGYVTKLAVDVEADSSKFPEDWLMLHRWGKGAKECKLPSGEKIEFVKVGSRASAFVPSLQKMPGKEGDGGGDEGGDKGSGSELEVKKPAKKRAPKKVAKKEEYEGSEMDEKPAPKRRAPARSTKKAAKREEAEEEESEPEKPKSRKRKGVATVKASPKKAKH